jgi:hypothetical protein
VPSPASDDDPRPLPPNRPDDEDCCGGGCNPCIFDYYYEEMDRYREDLRAWQSRHPERAESA